MARPISKIHLLRIEEFEKYGFIEPKPNEHYLLKLLRTTHRDTLRIFKSGHGISAGRTGSSIGTYEVFGGKVIYYYDIRRKEEFVEFLVKKFFVLNQYPDEYIRRVFTKMLHYHGLCWEGCAHDGKHRVKRKV